MKFRLIDSISAVHEDIEAADMATAKIQAEAWMREGDWDDSDGTTWIDVVIEDRTGGPLPSQTTGIQVYSVDGDLTGTLWCDADIDGLDDHLNDVFGLASALKDMGGTWWPSMPNLEDKSLIDQYAIVSSTDRNVRPDYPSETLTITIEQDEPQCTSDSGHDWTDNHVVGHGGGVIDTDTCSHCGVERVVDTWAQNRSTGEQGLASVKYVAAQPDSHIEDYYADADISC